MIYAKATSNQIDEIMAVYSSAITAMEDSGIHQWDEIYPDKSSIADDISGKYIVVFSGTKRQQFANEDCEMHVCCLDSKLKTEWDKQLKFSGYFCNILRTDNVYYVMGKFNKIHGLDNKDVDLGSGSGMFCYSIGSDGNWLKGENHELDKPIYPMWISKCDNTTFEVVSALDKAPESKPVNAAYMRFTFDGKETFNSMK